MAVVEQLLVTEGDGSISFGNYELEKKAKKEDFEYQGDVYKVKTYYEITKLEKNGRFLYESVPGTSVSHLTADGSGIRFQVEGKDDAQITLELEDDTEYQVVIDDVNVGTMKTNMSGKLNISVDFSQNASVRVEAKKQ
jgi:hypothetical protein